MVEKYLRRYIEMPALIYLLTERKITLLDPQSWDDSNDSHYLSVYKEKKHLKSVLALCFTQVGEMYHHWKVFAGSSSGVCIRFKKSELIRALEKHSGIETGAVKYLTIAMIRKMVKKKKLAIKQLPFIKRYAFQDEVEFRAIYESDTKELPKLDIPIPLSCIERIILSPWIRNNLSDSVKRILKSIKGCNELDIVRSTLVSNKEWKTIGGSVA